jgi:hypothetical protein
VTTHELLFAVLGVVAGVALNAFLGGRAIGKLETCVTTLVKRVDQIGQQLEGTGDNAFIRRAELSVLIKKADQEYSVMNGEIDTLRDVTSEHAKILVEHETKIAALREGA